MDIEKLQRDLDRAREGTKKVYPDKENDGSTWVKNDTFTTMRQTHIPNGNFEFRILPAVEGKNPGMYVVQKHKILESIGQKQDGSGQTFYNNIQVLGSVTNPEMTVIDDLVRELIHIEKTRPEDWALLSDDTKQIIANFKGETFIEVPCIFKADHVNAPFRIGTKMIDSYNLVKPSSKDSYVGKVFQMKSRSIYGARMKDDDGKWTDEYDGIIGIKKEWGNIDSLGEEGRWLKLSVEGKGGKGFPKYTVSPTTKVGALPDSLMYFMDEENYPNLYKKNDYFKKSNDEVLNMIRKSELLKILETFGFSHPLLTVSV